MTRPRLVPLLLILAVAVILVGGSFLLPQNATGKSETPNTWAVARFTVNDELVYFDEPVNGSATVSVTGCYTIQKNAGIGHTIYITYDEDDCPNTFLDVHLTTP